MSKDQDDARKLSADKAAEIPAPDLDYRPPRPTAYAPRIGLIGCGGISATHLEAYQKQGYEIVALCDRNLTAAEARRDEFFPNATVTDEVDAVLGDASVDVVDLATHPEHRRTAIRAALEAGKHVLSQKPFVTDLEVGHELADLAEARDLRLAVNQNGRWAPYFAYLRKAVNARLLGGVRSIDIQIAWDHRWTDDTAFVRVPHLILYDFAIHWFDIAACVLGERSGGRVFASTTGDASRPGRPPLAAQACVQYDDAAASLSFRGDCPFEPTESVTAVGAAGAFRSVGPVCGATEVTLATEAGRAVAELTGQWFPDGFAGAMGELLCAIEDDREPENSARKNLRSLELCFAAVASAERDAPVKIGSVTRLEPHWVHSPAS